MITGSAHFYPTLIFDMSEFLKNIKGKNPVLWGRPHTLAIDLDLDLTLRLAAKSI